jgi:RNA-directed DNA polymerase
VDNAIFKALWQWAIRRHPRKGKRWIKDKYFKVYGHRRWVFTGTIPAKNGASRTIHLFYAVATPIQRHVKIQGQANPYDLQWTDYFTSRQRKLLLNYISV